MNPNDKWGRIFEEVLKVLALLIGMFGLFGLCVLLGWALIELFVWFIF